MSTTRICNTCKGSGSVEYLISMHDDAKEFGTCHTCNGKGETHYMTDDEEQDYHDNYW